MKTYRRVVDFNYKNKKYSMFIDNKSKYYFLETINNKYHYIDFDTFVELGKIFTTPPILFFKNGQKAKITPKIIIGGVLATVTIGSNLLTATIVGNIKDNQYQSNYKEYQEYIVSSSNDLNQNTKTESEKNEQENINNKISFDVVDSDEELQLDTFLRLNFSNALYIYDNDYLGEYLDYKNVSLEDMYSIIDNNKNISEKFKKLVKGYCHDYVTIYPNCERRILYENLKTLKIVEFEDKNQLAVKTLSWDSLACYVKTENTIFVLKDYEYAEGTWDYQILYHELSHAARTIWNLDGERKVRIEPNGDNFNNSLIEETLNSLFAVSLYNKDEKDIAYQLQSNYVKVLIDNMDNYDLSDYMNHSLSYFAKKLDEFHGDNNYATVLLELIKVQYDDYHTKAIHIDKEEYYPIYEYVSDFYYKNRINENTTYEEALSYADELVKSVTYDVPDEYEIHKKYFYDYLDQYCSKLGIETTKNITF